MIEPGRIEHLSSRQVREIRKQLRGRDDGQHTVVARIGRLTSFPATQTGNVKRYRFGISTLLFAIFQLLIISILPADGRRVIFGGFAFLTATVAAWQIDKAKTR